MTYKIHTCLLKDLPCTIGFKFAPKPNYEQYADKISALNENAGCIYIHGESSNGEYAGATETQLVCVTLDLPTAEIIALRLNPECFFTSKTDQE